MHSVEQQEQQRSRVESHSQRPPRRTRVAAAHLLVDSLHFTSLHFTSLLESPKDRGQRTPAVLSRLAP